LITKPSAKDAIIIVAGLALRNRRKTMISDSTDKPAPIARISGINSTVGRLPAKTIAAASIDGQSSAKTQKAIVSPWAKFTSRITPKMRAMPSAPRA
jgi:hypothetical protein